MVLDRAAWAHCTTFPELVSPYLRCGSGRSMFGSLGSHGLVLGSSGRLVGVGHRCLGSDRMVGRSFARNRKGGMVRSASARLVDAARRNICGSPGLASGSGPVRHRRSTGRFGYGRCDVFVCSTSWKRDPRASGRSPYRQSNADAVGRTYLVGQHVAPGTKLGRYRADRGMDGNVGCCPL